MKYIIMCGGKYPKFKTPKQLLKVNDEVLVERTIRLLKENGVTDIAVSTNNPAFDYLDVELLHNKDDEFVTLSENEFKASKYSWLNAYYPMNEPVCYIHGDCYFSDEAIKTIVDTEVDKTMFFCVPDVQDIANKDKRNLKGREPLAYKVKDYKFFRNAIDELLKMVDEGKFRNAKCSPIAWTAYRYINGLDVGFNAQNYGDLNSIFDSKGDYIIINDYTTDIDDEKDIISIENILKLGGNEMVKCEVIERFTLGDFNKLQNIKRKAIDTKGTLYVGDTFDCDEEMAKYLSGGNSQKKVVVKVIEVMPKVEAKVEYHKEEKKPEVSIKLETEEVKEIAKQVNKAVKKSKKSKK